ncbi:MAG: RNA polymerase sigma factor [Bacteroidetes bacterium]|nr:RNA polymerase sigma factor [Bacteroidota bacterium]
MEEFGSFESIYRQYKNKVFNTAIGYLQNTEDAEEITQDVFVEIYHSLDTFRNESNLGTWVYRITVNKSLDHIRKRNRKKRMGFLSRLLGAEAEHESVPDFIHPGVLLENKERSIHLFAAIQKLPENQQTAFILSRLEDLGNKEIADVMKMSVGAVESLLSRAKENLRKQLAAEYKEDGHRRNPPKKSSNETGD